MQVKDTMRLLGVVKSTSLLSSKIELGATAGAWIIEEFTAQMRAVSKIALHRRSNLASFVELNGNVFFPIFPIFFSMHLIHSIYFWWR